MRRLLWSILLLGLMLLWALPTQAQYLTPPDPVPVGFSSTCASTMEGRYATLISEHRRMEAAISAHESSCASVLSSDTTRIEACLESQDDIELRAAIYLDALEKYTNDLRALLDADKADRDVARYEDEIAAMENRLASAKTEMGRINSRLASYQTQVQEWTQLASKARQEAVDTAISATIDVVTSRILDLGKELSIKKFNKLKNRLSSVETQLALRNQERFKAIRASSAQRAETLNDTATFIVFVQALKNGIGQFYAADSVQYGKDREEVLRGLLDVTSSAGGIAFPYISYLTADAKILAALAGGWHSYFVAKKNILFLLKLSEKDLELTTQATARVMKLTRSQLNLKTQFNEAVSRRDSLHNHGVDCH